MGLTTRVVKGERAEQLLVLMHGLGSNEHDLATLAPHIDPEGYFVTVCPRAPYSYGPGFTWAHIDNPDLRRTTMESSADAVEQVIADALTEYNFKREEMVVGGFSMGGGLALTIGLRPSDKPHPAGILSMSGFVHEGMEVDAPPLPPVLMQHGTYDQMIPIGHARNGAQFLQQHNVPLVFREYPMEHSVSPESARDAKDWLDQIRRGEKPQGLEVQVSASAPADDGGPVKTVNSTTFETEVLRSDKPVIVDFWAPWCGPCRAVAPIVEQIATMRGGAYKVVKLNIDENPDIAQRYDVKSIPLVALFRNGRMERASLGAKPRQQLEAELGMLVIP